LDINGSAERASLVAEDWETYAVQEALERATGFAVVRENDAACAALGRFWVGRIPATQGLATLYMATGFGCGIVIGGSLYRGASSNVGEIGHMVVDYDGPACWCGSRGCLEMLAAPRAVVRRAIETAGLAGLLGLRGTEADVRRDFALVAREAARGDGHCLPLIEESASYVARALLSTVNLLDIDLVYLAGPGFADAGPIYLRVIRDELTRLTRTRAVHGVTVEMSDPTLDAAARGAAALALQYALTPHSRPAPV
jgi:predicted NBD/HSP70 family sugar kinase